MDCSYTKEGNGFKVRNCILVKCKAVWNKYYGFILLNNKYLYKCHAISNQTGILVTSTNQELFQLPYFKFNNHTTSLRDYDDSGNITPRITNFINCSVRGSLGGSGIIYSIYTSYSLFLNCEISGNQGSLETFYDVINYKREYYFTGGGIKGFKDNTLCFINCSIVGNLGYGICIIDDLKKILSTTTRTFLDYEGNEIIVGDDDYSSEFIVASCSSNNVNTYEYIGSGNLYDQVSAGNSSPSNWRSSTITSDSASEHCNLYTNNIKEASSYIGHIILINTIVSTNRGGQIVKLFDFKNNFSNRYLEINSIIDDYKSDQFFTFPKNVCAWNPYKGFYEIGDESSRKKISLYEMTTVYNPIPPTSGSRLLYKGGGPEGGIFKAFKTPNNVDNARDDIDLRINSYVDKDNLTYTYIGFGGVQKKILEGCELFSGDRIKNTILTNINSKLTVHIDNSALVNHNFFKLFFNNDLSYLPDISHYHQLSRAYERQRNYRDDNFTQIGDKFYDTNTDPINLILSNLDSYKNSYKQFLELRLKSISNNIENSIQLNLKRILSLDFDDLERNINSNDYYIGCFEKHNYCNYQFNTVGREFNKTRREFTSTVNCCSGSDSADCSSTGIPSGISATYPSGLLRSLIVDYTDQDISFEQEELSNLCQSFQDSLGSRVNIGILPDLSDPDVAEDSCIIPNFEMYDFNGTFFETRFICGKDCEFNWNSWVKLIESEDNTLSLEKNNLEVHFRTGNIEKLNSQTISSLNSAGITTDEDINETKKLYPNICPGSGEFEFEESNEEFFCGRTSTNENIEDWFCNKRNRNELPLIPDGCPSFGGKKCPVSNVQFAMVNPGQDPSSIIKNDSFSIKNIVDDIINTNSGVNIDSFIQNEGVNNEIDPSDPLYLQSQCLTQGYIQPDRGLSGRIEQIRRQNYESPEDDTPYTTLVIIVIIVVILIGAVLFI